MYQTIKIWYIYALWRVLPSFCNFLHCAVQLNSLFSDPLNLYSFYTRLVKGKIYILFTRNRDEPKSRIQNHIRYKPFGRPCHTANCNSMPSKTYLLPGRANQKERTADQPAWTQVFPIKETVTEIAPEGYTGGGGATNFSLWVRDSFLLGWLVSRH